ncbi:D-tyrosyl-tRNA(Tyr) deacylase [Halobacteriovorax sp. BALOs_7]|uniref:D-aminoacyl-tRNA deacylase n=1 Tax=Halobacteriovorax sp. BALOs_7 TaxID=2109558 RepID=UPI000EA01930|nr:D-aminoacyl-tRNA deacylase [Halobacteriovorax sp. BALOs_7]AYF44150.1 D-tyrosyl-tRNA(Tyr) deacylase [Halobacteriovorax sp. BALOs_7]
MKIVVQRVSSSQVKVNNEIVGQIEKGLNLLVCIEHDDTMQTLKKAADKIVALRIFSDESGRMNKSVVDIEGSILAISQFTLSWNGKKGNRPSFDGSAKPEVAQNLFNEFVKLLNEKVPVETGIFGESMAVVINNDGPVTFHIEF